MRLCRNVRGLNAGDRRDNVRTLVHDARPHVKCLVEIKWKERNGRCFRQVPSVVMQILTHIKHLVGQWIDTGAAELGSLVRK
jgi:hypothetical protein